MRGSELLWQGTPDDLREDSSLIESGVIDSLRIVKMVSFLESEFGIKTRMTRSSRGTSSQSAHSRSSLAQDRVLINGWRCHPTIKPAVAEKPNPAVKDVSELREGEPHPRFVRRGRRPTPGC